MKRFPLFLEIKGGPMDNLESKFGLAKLEVKETQKDGSILHIKAYALAFGNVDSWGDIIDPHACDDFLKSADADRMALCWQHDRTTVIGIITDKGVDDYGMWIEADILPTTAGQDAAILLKSGAVKEMSIGYRATQYRWEKREGYDYDIRVIEKLTVYECSPVTIAANANAIVVSAKSLGHESEAAPEDPKSEDDNANSNQHKSFKAMTPEEIQAMRESIEKSAAEKAAAELKAKIDEIKAQKETIDAQEKSIDNLDKSMKALQAQMDEMKKKAIVDFKSEMRSVLEEKRPELQRMFEAKEKDFTIELELKTVYDIGTSLVNPNNILSVAMDPTIHAAKPVANVFIEAFGIKPRTANKMSWIESSQQNGADYVAELAQNTNKSDVSFTEKTRKYGKLAHTMRISTEFADWFEQLYQYCIGEGQRMIMAKLDQEIWSGLGNDTADAGTGASPDKIYGIKHYATAFSNLAQYEGANYADVLFDAAMQIAKEGFSANAAFVTWAEYAALINAKDKNGNRLFNAATQMLGALRLYPTTRLSSGEALVADTNCAEPSAGNSFELEFIRNGAYDAYDVYFRRAAQVKITTPGAKGLIYIDDIDDAVDDIYIATDLEGVIDTEAGAIKTKAVSTT